MGTGTDNKKTLARDNAKHKEGIDDSAFFFLYFLLVTELVTRTVVFYKSQYFLIDIFCSFRFM
jgi:hypothetical protein